MWHELNGVRRGVAFSSFNEEADSLRGAIVYAKIGLGGLGTSR